MAQQHGFGPVPLAFLRGKQSAELRLNPQHLEEILRARYPAEALRLALAAQEIVTDAVKGEVTSHVGKGPIAFAEVQQVPDLGSLARKAAGVVICDPDQPLRFEKRQRAKQRSEERRVGKECRSR